MTTEPAKRVAGCLLAWIAVYHLFVTAAPASVKIVAAAVVLLLILWLLGLWPS